MITEKPPNSNLDIWFETWKPRRVVFGQKEMESFLKQYEDVNAAKFWYKSPIMAYDSARRFLRGAYGEIFEHLFSNYMSGAETVLELGCGIEPSLYKMVQERLRENWLFTDVSPYNLYCIKLMHLPATGTSKSASFTAASFHDLPFRDISQGVIAEMNSLETTLEKKGAISEIQRCLRKGGYLMVMQDVGPNGAGTVLREYVKDGGKEVVAYMDETRDFSFPVNLSATALETARGIIDCRSYHVDDVREIAESLGMTTLFCGIVGSEGFFKREKRHEFPELWKEEDPEFYKEERNYFSDVVSQFKMEKRDFPEGKVFEQASVNAAIFQK